MRYVGTKVIWMEPWLPRRCVSGKLFSHRPLLSSHWRSGNRGPKEVKVLVLWLDVNDACNCRKSSRRLEPGLGWGCGTQLLSGSPWGLSGTLPTLNCTELSCSIPEDCEAWFECDAKQGHILPEGHCSGLLPSSVPRNVSTSGPSSLPFPLSWAWVPTPYQPFSIAKEGL